jgi:hypothetical protein
MQPPDEFVNRSQLIAKSVGDLQWAHETMVRLAAIVHHNGLIGPKLNECVVQMQKAIVLLEGLIQEHLRHARRRHDDVGPEGGTEIEPF